MRVVKPYGRSHVEADSVAGTKRVLRLRSKPDEKRDIEDFARSHDELIIAQWISTIDKIATKPSGKNGATDEQRALRKQLGDAAWALLETKGLLPGLKDAAGKDCLSRRWDMKVAPYGEATYRPRGQNPRPPSAKGRWYDRFTGGVDVADVDAMEVAQKIYEHLYVAEHRIGGGASNRKRGRIAAGARSIARNVPRPPKPLSNEKRIWSDRDKKIYAAAGDVADKIRKAAEDRESVGRKPARPSGFRMRDAAPFLYEHYGLLFRDSEGRVLPINEAREAFPGLFALHGAVKETYTRILKNHRKRSVARVLPGDMTALFGLVEAKLDNRDLNALVRLGKVVHYEASGGSADSPAALVRNWPVNVTDSLFWTSDGQARIKRNEAFVRVWRHVLALASRTLTDWADPGGCLRV